MKFTIPIFGSLAISVFSVKIEADEEQAEAHHPYASVYDSLQAPAAHHASHHQMCAHVEHALYEAECKTNILTNEKKALETKHKELKADLDKCQTELEQQREDKVSSLEEQIKELQEQLKENGGGSNDKVITSFGNEKNDMCFEPGYFCASCSVEQCLDERNPNDCEIRYGTGDPNSQMPGPISDACVQRER